MNVEMFADHLQSPRRRGHIPADACSGAAGGAACGDLIRISLALDRLSPQGRILDAGFDASGCGAAIAAGSATVQLVSGAALLDAALVGAPQIAAELGGLSPAKQHAAELASDALHRALGWAAREHAALAHSPSRTLVAMSGGVDSAVAALLVAEGGEQTVAVTLELWSDPENDGERSCCSAQAVRSARSLAHEMGMAHFSIDLREEFRAGVVDGWLADHAAGLTPNPCVRCNGKVRLDAMLELADRLGARKLATGHYARTESDGEGEPLLRMAVDEGKDQSYALVALSPSSLARLRFPLGSLRKPEVREHAAQAGLEVARRPDSQDLCFLAGTRGSDFLERHGGIKRRAGAVLDGQGRKLGEHGGVHTLTVGQRHGLGIGGGTVDGAEGPLYVIATDARSNTVTVGPREQLRTAAVNVREVTLHRDGARVDAVKVRYRGRRMPCRVRDEPRAGLHERVELQMFDPIERTAPGQIACLYEGDVIVGYGTIAI
ncbi:MAG TPA: tRNA 2-thiouridine(34) synthase MnmA [Solirubrobacteraceae bacterium]|jgi:tRNA-specific 2-thiouridylase|nr:tRNA 2-thiouridine(34) synthase MnmA [Solirubrobacteraceae bacterium]